MKIQVLGSGCPTCKKMFELTQEAVKQLHLETEIEYSTDVAKIIEMGLMSSPVLAIDGQPVIVGTANLEQIKKALGGATPETESLAGCRCGKSDGCGSGCCKDDGHGCCGGHC